MQNKLSIAEMMANLAPVVQITILIGTAIMQIASAIQKAKVKEYMWLQITYHIDFMAS